MIPVALGMDRVVGTLSRALHIRGARHNTVADLSPYLAIDKEALFPAPGRAVAMAEGFAFAPWNGRDQTTVRLSWESTHTPLSATYVARHRGDYHRNLTATARWTYPKHGPQKRALIYVHGWLAPGPWVEGALLVPRFGDAARADTVHIELPFHGSRKPRSSLFHGEFYWTADLVRSLEAVRQSVHDIRTLAVWLRARGYEEVGVMGVSLGGSLTMLTGCLSDPPDYIIPIVGHLQLGKAVEEAGILSRMKSDLEGFGVDALARKEIFERLGVERMLPTVAPERQLWIMAKHDGYMVRADVERQWRAWGEPPIVWVEGGHMTFPLTVPRMIAAVREFRGRLDEMAQARL